MNVMMRAVRRLLVPLGVLMLIAGCGPSGDQAGKPVTVKWAFILPTSWDPVTSRTGADINTIGLAYASLTRLDHAGKAEPSLAKSWRYNADGTAITFELRDGLKFTDGTPLDANAVKAFFERGKTEKDSFLKDQLEDVESVSVESPTLVTLHLSQPDYQIPYLVAGRTGAISSPAAAQTDLAKLSLWPVGAGPFKMVEFVAESYAHFVKNPDYWDADNIHIDRLELTVSPDPSTMVAGVLSGSIDLVMLPPTKVAEAKASGLTVTIAPSLSARDISINLNKPPFTDPNVVEAFRYAFDPQEFVKVLTDGLGSVTHQPFPPDYFAADPAVETLWSYDRARAAKLLVDAGYPPGSLAVTITTSVVLYSGTAELIQAQLAKIGVKATIRVLPPGSSTMQSVVYVAKDAQLATDGTIGRESPVQNLLATFGPSGIMNLSGPHATDQFLNALDAVRKTPLDDPQYLPRLHEAVRIGVEQSPSDYLFSVPWILASKPALKNLNIQPSQIRWEGVTVQ
jgi:peptide/nickel transport system substrate-binding protein